MRTETLTMLRAFVGAAVTDAAERKEALQLLARGEKDEWLSPAAAVKFAGVSRRTLFSWEKSGLIHPKHTTKRRTRFSKRELEQVAGAALP